MSTQMPSPGPAPDFHTLFESAPGLYLVLAPDLKIVAASEAYLRATLTQREAILNRRIFEVFPENPGEAGATGIRDLRASLERVLLHKTPDAMAGQMYDVGKSKPKGLVAGVRYWIPVNSPVLGSDGEVAYIIHQIHDLTGFVGLTQMESEPANLNRELEAPAAPKVPEVQLRTQDVHEANWLLEGAYKELAKLSEELEARVVERTAQLAEANAQLEAELAERKRVERQLIHSQKLEAVGRLAGGVAHDFNNLLTILQGYSEILLMQTPAGSAQHEQLNEITRASEGAAALTRQLLAFSRQQLLEARVLDLNEVVAEVGKMLRRTIGEDIDLVTVLDSNACRIKADPEQIEQILLNLAVNARDAMPKGGKLTIETVSVEIDETDARDHLSVKPGPYVMLTMSDTGVGMDAQTQQHLFEPFFTTKEQGEGTGLGLSTVYGVVKQCGGNIWFYSELGRGSSFRIYLPREAEAAAPAAPAPHAQGAGTPLEGTETILLVEDEDAVRSLIRVYLREKGYNVLDAGASNDALGILQQAAGPIDLVLTDVVLPGMSGPELAETVRATNPQMKLLYMSGYTDDTLHQHGVLEPGIHFIQKPFRPLDLVRKIREIMDTPEIK